MAERKTCTWNGASGKNYKYYVYPRHPTMNADQVGNYIYAKLNDSGLWVPIYIGEGDLSVRCTRSHHQIQCIDAKGATHVHMHLNSDQQSRWAEESDLLAHYTNAHTPYGCNVAPKG